MRAVLALMAWLGGLVAGYAQDLPAEISVIVQQNPARFLDRAAGLIDGFGSAQGIDRAGIELALALRRADARAGAMLKLMEADLDFDGAISHDEMAKVASAAAAATRGKLWKSQRRADEDGDGLVSAGEMEAFGRAEAMQQVSTDDAAEALAILSFDLDKNGWVDLEEVTKALATLPPKAKAPLPASAGPPTL